MNPRSLTYEKNGGWKTLGKVTFQGRAVKLLGGRGRSTDQNMCFAFDGIWSIYLPFCFNETNQHDNMLIVGQKTCVYWGGKDPWKFVDKKVVCIVDILVEIPPEFLVNSKVPQCSLVVQTKKHRTWPQISKLAGWLIIISARKQRHFCKWCKKNGWFEIFACPANHSRGSLHSQPKQW